LLSALSENNKQKLIYSISFAFIILNAFAIVYEFYWFSLLPVVLAVGMWAIFSLDKLVMLAVFFTPLSIGLKNVGFGFGISLPTEPLLAIILGMCILKYLYDGKGDTKILNHIITTSIIINLIWMGISTITSEMPLVSLKLFIARLWFVISFFAMPLILFRKYSNMHKYVWLYLIAFIGVVIYILIRHALNGFTEQSAHWVPSPFYKDHTSYGAILAMFFPFLFYFIWYFKKNKFLQLVFIFILLLFIPATILSYTRAAWMSLAVALGVFTIMKFRIKIRTIAASAILFIALLFAFQNQIFMALEKNRQDSSSDLKEHVRSISNISSDASNLERINRWKSALRMFEERPIWGWGPGTYMFQYASFQLSSEKTVISTNAGDKGNAHSEYIGPLAEAGLLGSLSFILIVICISLTAIKIIYKVKNENIKMLTLASFLSLITYFVHGFFNNFLDTDKASAPFWGFAAIITAIDLFHYRKEEKLEESATE
jgi:O-antigen ligase